MRDLSATLKMTNAGAAFVPYGSHTQYLRSQIPRYALNDGWGWLVDGRGIRWECFRMIIRLKNFEWFALAITRFFVALENDKPIINARSHYYF
jgi:hypothetical protein